jgi:hypothetical protein
MDVITEILSLLPVKSLMRFSCINKSFYTLISDPYFVQMHLKKSKRNPQLSAITGNYTSVVTFTKISSLLQNSWTTIQYDNLPSNHNRWSLVGSCNGLLCLNDKNGERLYFWNPATKSEFFLTYSLNYSQFSFGYDVSTKTYKVVVI